MLGINLDRAQIANMLSADPSTKELSIGPLVKRILARKLAKTCWKEPGPNDPFTHTFYEQCFHFGFHHTLGISERQFQDWLEGQAVEIEVPRFSRRRMT